MVSGNGETLAGDDRTMNTSLDIPQATPPAIEAPSLARELVNAREGMVAYYRRQYGQNIPEAVKNTEEFFATNAANVERILKTPADNTSWYEIEQLATADPALAARRWEEIKEAAYQELASGHGPAKAVESSEQTCWKRAQFLALRDDLANQWRPRGGIEWALIDMMAQALTLQTFWTHRLVMLDVLEWPDPPSKEMAKFQPPRIGQSMAMDQAAGMVDRFNRMFMRALRQLRDLRRYTVVIQSAEQVNIGQQQVNVTPAPETPEVRDEAPRAILTADEDGRVNHRPGPRKRNRRKPTQPIPAPVDKRGRKSR